MTVSHYNLILNLLHLAALVGMLTALLFLRVESLGVLRSLKDVNERLVSLIDKLLDHKIGKN